ncbi:carboxylate-amine ligase [Actinomadura parmotrematis]|uniref:Putative glutamate--cysteine ligase 2 n=1 Tax=Actinomadura parmotrematis TaxID=2864039 RepID=A0ABS7G151_9ACTN|nr:glutamate--cysteine ligase [Actinomadura parmotrematis]MBW8486439.1 glutamate--cysteine ligase [Actinomadura parmotrematis]
MTLGVEEEFLLVAPGPGTPVGRIAPILAHGAADPGAEGGRFAAEMLGTQVEVVTGICGDLGSLREQLVRGRARLASAAEAEGVRPLATGTPVLEDGVPPFAAGARFARIGEMYQRVARDYQVCGCHVHVGVPDLETAVAVADHLRPWLPTLLALSVNSPYRNGADTGYQSWRIAEMARFPNAGVPPRHGSADVYLERVQRLVDSGMLVDSTMTFWLARASVRYSTVEVRAADTAASVHDAVLQAALTRGLVRTALHELAAGREAPDADDQVCAAALWAASRYGLNGPGVHAVRGVQLPARALVDELVAWARPGLEETGDLPAVRALLAWLDRTGTGADRQRRAAADGLPAVVDMLADQFLAAAGDTPNGTHPNALNTPHEA